MADVRIQIEKLWVEDFYPWVSTNYPFSTIDREQDIITISTNTPKILYDYVLSVDTQALTLTNPNSTIIEGTGTSFDADTQVFTFLNPVPKINYDYTIFPDVKTITLTQLQIRKAGNPWDSREIPSTCSQWEERNQVLWSPLVYPWVETFYPWQVGDRIEQSVYTERTKPTTTYTERTKPTTTYTERTKPTTNWN